MSRIKLDSPDSYEFAVDLPVRITDINYGNHLGHDSIMSILHEARVRCLNDKGLSEIDIGGCGIIMADTGIVFKHEVFYPATLRCEVAVRNISRSGFDVYYRITRVEDGALIAEAKTGMVCFDYTKKKPERVPDRFRAAFQPEP